MSDSASDNLPLCEFAYPGPLRDKLVGAVLRGEKTATSSLRAEYEAESEPLPVVGARSAVIDSAGDIVAVIEVTEVRVVRLADADVRLARDEGEGFADVAAWRVAHEEFWTSPEYVEEYDFPVTDDTLVVAQWFRVVERIAS